MKVKRNIFAFVAACILTFFNPLYGFADRCDDVMAKARRIFDAAMAASKEKQYAKAVRLYEEAEEYYKKASEMKYCRCPKIADTAKKNISICRNNAASNRKALEKQENYKADLKVFDTYNQAKMKYNEGNSYARTKQWERAISAFEEAAEIWESIASTETENGRKAIQAAKQARHLADLARQQLER